jgi:predicted ATP-dependent endonuclease of OLD family
MRIIRLVIPNFKNLKGFKLEPDSQHMTTVVIGQNATGKSNLIEALVLIFRHLDLAEEPPKELQNYEIEYVCRENKVHITAIDGETKIEVTDRGKKQPHKLSLGKLAKAANELLPRHIFAYYSGRNERLEGLFHEHQKRQFQSYRGELKRTDAGDYALKSDDVPLRRLFYCRNEHSQPILLTYLIEQARNGNANYKEKSDLLKEYLGIEGLESALFVLKKPHGEPSSLMKSKGDERFWYASGVLAETIDVLWRNALAPIDHELDKTIDFRGHKRKQETLYLYLDCKRLLRAADEIGDTMHFFRQLEGLYMADFLDEIRIQVKRVGIHEPLFFRELSEGEQQLMTVLGLIRFTRDDETLFLLDEPDTHLNPIWKYNYFQMIDRLFGENENQRNKNQLFMTTHDPLMLGSLVKEQVRVLTQVAGELSAEEPVQDPRGMGFTALLRSEMFGLRSTIDYQTLMDLDDRNRLMSIRAKDGLDNAQKARLEELQKRLDELGFGYETKDPLYQFFLEKLYEHKRKPLSKVLTQQQIQEQEKLADKIVREVIHKEKMDDLSDLARELKIELSK